MTKPRVFELDGKWYWSIPGSENSEENSDPFNTEKAATEDLNRVLRKKREKSSEN
jgi:hypothetical protein